MLHSVLYIIGVGGVSHGGSPCWKLRCICENICRNHMKRASKHQSTKLFIDAHMEIPNRGQPTHTHARTHAHMHARTQTRTQTGTHAHTHAHSNANACTHARTHAHTHTNKRRHTHTHAHTHTCTHARHTHLHFHLHLRHLAEAFIQSDLH